MPARGSGATVAESAHPVVALHGILAEGVNLRVGLDDLVPPNVLCILGENLLQGDPGNNPCHRQAVVHSGMVGIKLAVPIARNTITEAVDAISCHAALVHDFCCHLWINGLKCRQSIGLDLQTTASGLKNRLRRQRNRRPVGAEISRLLIASPVLQTYSFVFRMQMQASQPRVM